MLVLKNSQSFTNALNVPDRGFVHWARFELCFKDSAQRTWPGRPPTTVGPLWITFSVLVATALGALAYIVLLVPNGNLSEEFARESTIEIPMDDLDTSSESRRGLRFVLFAVLLCAYLISGILPVTTYTNGNGNSEYLYGHHAFFYSLTGKKSDRERPQQWGLLPNFAFLAGMTMLFHGQYLGAAGAGAVATCLAIAVFGIGPDDFRPCSAADVYWCHDWKNLPHAHGPFLIGFYVWSLTFASLCAVGVVGMIKPRSSDGLDEPASTPRI